MPRRRRRLPLKPFAAATVPLSLILAASAVAQTAAQTPSAPAVIPASAPASPISVSVDGDPIVFPGQGPVMDASGSVLVPLRGVFEKLGAGVTYSNATRTVTAVKGDTTLSLRMGDPTAYINNMPRPLSVAPQMRNNTTLVPLRFIGEAFGAQVKWDAAARTVVIALPRPPDNTPLIGSVVAFDANARTVTLRPAGTDKDVTVGLIPDAPVLIKAGDAPATVADLSALRTGDLVTIKRNDQGNGFSLQADYEERHGEIKVVDAAPATGNPMITFADNTAAEVLLTAPVFRGTEPITLTDLKPGQKVVLRVNPQTRLASVVTVDIPKVEIASITQGAGDRTVKAGDVVTITLVGTPGAKGTFSVPGLAGIAEQPLTESPTTPGTYTGTFTVPAGASLQNGMVTGTLAIGEIAAPAVQSPSTLNIDAVAPAVTDLLPAADANLTIRRPRFSATYTDAGSGVEPEQTRLFVNGKDVTAQAKIEKGFVLYEPTADLPAKENTVTLVVRDKVGNENRQEWTFTVTPVFSPLRIVTLVDVPEGRPLGAGATFKVRAEADKGGSAKFRVGKDGVISGPMLEESPGVYVGTYTVPRGTALSRQPVTVYYTAPGSDKEVSLAAAQTLTINAGAPRPPVIDLPVEGSATGRYVTISGRGTPDTKVRLKITYSGRVFLLGTSAEGRVESKDLKVDADGQWRSDIIDLTTSGELRGVTFTAEVVTVAADGSVSDPAQVTFKR